MPLSKAVRLYNASKIVSGPMTALTANSPYFLGKDLWAESRVPVFEQAVQVGQSDLTKRVSFGIRYAHESIMEVFESNLARYPIMLPRVLDEPVETLAHLRLHNGTIWRWNRPLVGFDEDGTPHFRLEHRCVPAGPSLQDSIANAAFFYGIVTYLADQDEPYEKQIPFHNVRNNFYACAYHGFDAEVIWLHGKRMQVNELLSRELLPRARQGLLQLGVDESEVSYWLEIVEDRIAKKVSGAVWQRQFIAKRHSMQEMLQQYIQNQVTGLPVNQWDL
jgi:gamma-glutamyl:cysteine ligase YbdK (ATP-grasp superfamily)